MKRAALVGVATGLVALGLPVSQAAAGETPEELGGYSLATISTPIRVELYESLVPIPSTPQFEVNVGYTKAVTSSGPASKGRSSWLWPGDPVGEGLKTFGEMLGLPPQLTEDGYQVQVNSEYPGDAGSQKDEQFPGAVMRTSADEEQTISKAGYSSTGDVKDGKKKDADGDGGEGGGAPGLPELPGLPGLADGLKTLSGGKTAKSLTVAEDDPGMPGLEALADVVSAGGVQSMSKTEYGAGDSVTATGISRIGDLELLGGVITAESVKVMSTTTSTLTTSKSTNDVQVGGLAIGGVPFGFGSDGAVVGGQKQEIPGLPDEADEALAQLGVSFKLPTATKSQEGGSGEQSVRGLTVEIDFATLRNQLDTAPVDSVLGEIAKNLPEEAGPLKGLIGAPTQARPRIVIVLGDVTTEASTVEGFEFEAPTVPTEPPALESGDGAGDGAGSVGDLGGGAPTSGGDVPVTAGGDISGEVPAGDGAVEAGFQPQGAGLPPLGSIPGALMIGGLALAGVLGWWMQKMGGLVLGGATACAHGLASGIPDLRKA